MSVGYQAVQWNRQKRWYDGALAGLVLLGIGIYVGTSTVLRPEMTVETLLLRSTAVAAFMLLHVILVIGPLSRIDRRFLPLLYNRRHLGVTMFLLAAFHATLATFQFHALSDANPLVSIFTAYADDYRRVSEFPFEPFGFFALSILFVMAATSHDFWLKRLGPSWWKSIHLMVLVAYGLLVSHVAFGVLQSERGSVYPMLLAAGVVTVFGLHLVAAMIESYSDRDADSPEQDGFVRACAVDELPKGRGKTVRIGGERVAVYVHEDRVFAVSNVCRHQGGPLGEGRLIDGCITCPWHGWQYRPADGCSPPPFEERIETYRVRIHDRAVWIHPAAAPPGSEQDGARTAGRR